MSNSFSHLAVLMPFRSCSSRRLPFRGALVAGASALVLAPVAATAQTGVQGAAAPPPFTLSPATMQAAHAAATQAATRTVNVLIIALDDPATTPATTLSGAPLTGAPLTGAPPADDVPLTALPPAPMAWHDAPLRESWSVLAKKKPKKSGPDMSATPDPPSNLTPDGVFAPTKTPSATTTPNTGNADAGATPAETTTAQGLVPVPLGSASATGRSFLAALALKRTLAAQGYPGAEVAAPDSALVWRALNDHRLALGTVGALRDALKALSNAATLPPADRGAAIASATQAAADAASALGQATGYRAVVALSQAPFAEGKASFAAVVCDSARESGSPVLWSESGTDEASAREVGAASGAALVAKTLSSWPTASVSAKALAQTHLDRARAAGQAGNFMLAKDEVARVLALDPSRADAYTFLGDLLAPTNLSDALDLYRKATEINSKDGQTYAKLAVALSRSPKPDYPRILSAGNQAIAGGADGVDVRLAMANAQFGRGLLFRNAGFPDQADVADAAAQTHVERALELSPNNPEALKLLARAYVVSGNTYQAVQTLDRVAPQFPNDAGLQKQYALALLSLANRREDAFAAYARAIKASDQRDVSVDDASAQLLVLGFDDHVVALGKAARQIGEGVAAGTIAREPAVLQLKKLKDDMSDARDAINTMRAPAGTSSRAALARTLAADLMNQSLETQQTFLDTGQDIYRTRAVDLLRQAVAQLNVARSGR